MTDQNNSVDPTLQDSGKENTDSIKNDNTGSENKKTDSPEVYAKKMKARADREASKAKEATKVANEAKAQVEDLQKQIDSQSDSTGDLSDVEIQKIADDNDVDPSLIKGIVGSVQKTVTGATEKLVDSKLSELKKEGEKRELRSKFSNDLDSTLTSEYEGLDLGGEAKSAIELHYFTQLKENPDYTVEDAMDALYSGMKTGKNTSEDDVRGIDDGGNDSVDFDEVARDPELLEKINANPKLKKDYYAWRDNKGI